MLARVNQHAQDIAITSPQNPRVKDLVRYRRRPHRDEAGVILVEGYREILRALDNDRSPTELFCCPGLYQGENEDALVGRARGSGASVFTCSEPVFCKVAYRERPEGLLAVIPQRRLGLDDLQLPDCPLLLVAEAIEKPGNLGSILRSADAAGVDAVIVCDECTDINNPNAVRSSIGTIFSLPVAEASSEATLAWLKGHDMRILAATPHTDREYTEVDMTQPVALVVGTEKFGLSDRWMTEADLPVRIPMLGQVDSLNVSCATTILLYEAVRQRRG